MAHRLAHPLRSYPVSGQSHQLSCHCHETIPVSAHVYLSETNLHRKTLITLCSQITMKSTFKESEVSYIPLSTPLKEPDNSCTSLFDLMGDQFPSSLNWISSQSEQLFKISMNNLWKQRVVSIQFSKFATKVTLFLPFHHPLKLLFWKDSIYSICPGPIWAPRLYRCCFGGGFMYIWTDEFWCRKVDLHNRCMSLKGYEMAKHTKRARDYVSNVFTAAIFFIHLLWKSPGTWCKYPAIK